MKVAIILIAINIPAAGAAPRLHSATAVDETLKTTIPYRGGSLPRGLLRLFGWHGVLEGLPGSHGQVASVV
jgi:hypothetical protein